MEINAVLKYNGFFNLTFEPDKNLEFLQMTIKMPSFQIVVQHKVI